MQTHIKTYIHTFIHTHTFNKAIKRKQQQTAYRVVAIALHKIAHVLDVFRHIAEQSVLVHDCDAHAVQDVEQHGNRRVVAHAPALSANAAHGLRAEQIDAV